MHVLRPDRVKVIPGNDGWPEGYEYTAGGQTVRFVDDVVPGVRPILHTRLFHPANDHYGMSPIEAAAVAIDIHNTASGWNKALLDNSARRLAWRFRLSLRRAGRKRGYRVRWSMARPMGR